MYARLFFLVSLTLISILPTINLINSGVPGAFGLKNKIKSLYSIDILEGCYNKVLFEFGISNNPNQVVVGSDGWLFLGDQYDNTISEFRKGSDSKNELSKKITEVQSKWSEYFSHKGVEDFKIIIGPNKSTVYSERFPNWAKNEGKSISMNLYDNDIYINSIDVLMAAKKEGQTYFSSDTHWNSFGASVAFEQLMEAINPKTPFVFPSKDWSNIVDIEEREGGDLAKFLKAKHFISDSIVTTQLNMYAHEHSIYDYNSKALVYQGQNALYGSMNHPYVIHTPNALNQSKVLWLSDSFGSAMAPYMAATFSHILKRHWGDVVGTPLLGQLVEDWKPDYVFYTVVERSSLSGAFLKLPPTQLKLNSIGAILKPRLHSINSIGDSEYSVSGRDPFLVFDLKEKFLLNSYEEYRLNFNLDCQGSSEVIPIQLFWHSKESAFNETQSVRFKAINGNNQVVLYGLNTINDIASFRIDLDGVVTCNEFIMSDVQLGIPANI